MKKRALLPVPLPNPLPDVKIPLPVSEEEIKRKVGWLSQTQLAVIAVLGTLAGSGLVYKWASDFTGPNPYDEQIRPDPEPEPRPPNRPKPSKGPLINGDAGRKLSNKKKATIDHNIDIMKENKGYSYLLSGDNKGRTGRTWSEVQREREDLRNVQESAALGWKFLK